uniref:Ceramidase n=1 Tax=Panagrolaimus sp. JU765 TaxID=591449 RepID=A0AC34R5Y6_9BILA
MRSIYILSTVLFVGIVATPPEGKFAPKCVVGSGIYDPAKAGEVPWLTVDLDLPPEERYKRIVAPFAEGMKEVIDTIKQMAQLIPGDFLIPLLEELMQHAHDLLFPREYALEIDGIAEATGISVADLSMMNIYYELSRFCTSIVAQDVNGQTYHARNLDFGQLFVWDTKLSTWHLSEALRKVTVNIDFVKNGQVIFKGTTFAGHIGIITGMKPDKFTISMNAKDFLSGITQLAGCYYILGGKNVDEGVIIVRNETSVLDYVELNSQKDVWYVLQTNYDPQQTPIFLDDRRTPGNNCMKQLTQSRVNASGLFEVLSSKTTLNKTTVHTVIMSLATGLYQTFIQRCPDPCWFL